MRHCVATVLSFLTLVACGKAPPSNVGAHRLVDQMKPEMVHGSLAQAKAAEPAGFWNFKERTSRPTPKESQETLGWKAGVNVAGLAERNGRLTGRSTSGFPIIYVDRKPSADESDVAYSLEIHMRVDKGTNVSVSAEEDEKLKFKEIVEMASEFPWVTTTPIVPGDDFQTYTLRAPILARLSTIRYLLLRPTDADQATFEIESIRLVSRKEFLDRISSGVGWQGLSDIYRETVVARAPESISWEVQLPDKPVLDLHVGTIEYGPVRFRLALSPASGTAKEEVLTEYTVTTPHRWEPLSTDLSSHARQRVRLSLSLAADTTGALGFWGGPAVRDLVTAPAAAKRKKPTVDLGASDPPQGVILMIADTLRRDHLNLYGYGRETAPVLARMASQGALFTDNTSQATWTKVSMP
jgi:hypothetical protein